MALCLIIISGIAIVILAAATMGFTATGGITTSLLMAGAVCGLVYGLVLHSRRTGDKAKPTIPNGEQFESDLPGARRVRKARSWKPGPVFLLFFAIGLVISCVIAWTAIDVAIAVSPSRLLGTNVNGFGEVSGWLQVLTGVGIAALGWILAVMLWWAKWIRGFTIGLLAGSTALGLLCVFWQ